MTFIFKHNLTKSAWGDLLNLVSVLIPNMNKSLSSIYNMRVLVEKFLVV